MSNNADAFKREINTLKSKTKDLTERIKSDYDEFQSDFKPIEGDLQQLRQEIGIGPALRIVEPIEINNSENSTGFNSDIFNQYEAMSMNDLIMAILAGMAGVATSWALRYEGFGATKIKDGKLVSDGGILADIHDGNYRKSVNPTLYKIQECFEHPDNPFDKLNGAFHRLRYGHDIFNWNQEALDGTKLWEEMIKKHGNVDVSSFGSINKFLGVLNTIGRYFALYIFDSFSKEGLPLPFSSFFNIKEVNELGEFVYKNRLESLVGGRQDIYSTFLTIKARDVFGTGLTAMLLAAYREIQEKKGSKVIKNQKYYEMNCVAYFIVFAGGLSISAFDLNTASLNYPSLLLLLKNTLQLNMVLSANRKIINAEYEVLIAESVKEIDVGKTISELIKEKEQLHF